VPWLGTHVVITKHRSPLKGYSGVVKDVLRGRATPSDLRIVIQLTHLNPSNPFQSEIFDYDEVIEKSLVNLSLKWL
jgi:hypothetical protein